MRHMLYSTSIYRYSILCILSLTVRATEHRTDEPAVAGQQLPLSTLVAVGVLVLEAPLLLLFDVGDLNDAVVLIRGVARAVVEAVELFAVERALGRARPGELREISKLGQNGTY